LHIRSLSVIGKKKRKITHGVGNEVTLGKKRTALVPQKEKRRKDRAGDKKKKGSRGSGAVERHRLKRSISIRRMTQVQGQEREKKKEKKKKFAANMGKRSPVILNSWRREKSNGQKEKKRETANAVKGKKALRC